MSLLAFFGICLLISGITIRMAISMARRFGVMDHPGGHKQHDASTPFVGGFGVLTALIASFTLAHYYLPDVSMDPLDPIVVGAGVIFLTGLADDIWQLNYKTRFLSQALVALSMVFLGRVTLGNLGGLLSGLEIELGLLAIPFTIFATIGVINALNMIDGIDGLSGSVSLVSLMLIGLVAYLAGNSTYLTLSIALMGGVAGFLYFNLRYPTNHRARVFLGDNGSMLLGFLFAWMLIDLSQGEERAMPAVTALWLFALPLMDTVGVMLRRIWLRKSPFCADRNHLHHLFLRAGFRVSDTVMILALNQLLLGMVGIGGLWLGITESVMFLGFLLTFGLYFYIIARPWRFVPTLRRLNQALDLPSAQTRGIYIGYVRHQDTRKLVDILTKELGDQREYHLSLHERASEKPEGASVYAILELPLSKADASLSDIKSLSDKLHTRLADWHRIQVRLFLQRNSEHDHLEQTRPPAHTGNRGADRRGQQHKPPIQTLRQTEAKAGQEDALPVQ